MNQLSIWIYLAGLADNIQTISILGSLFGGIVLCIWTGIAYAESDDSILPPKKLWWVLMFSLFVACFTPSQKTIYMIMASEISGKVLESPEGKKLETQVLNKLDELLSENHSGK